MPELPEITVIARQMDKELSGKTVSKVETRQPKNLNMPLVQFSEAVQGKAIKNVSSRGKWIFVNLESNGLMLINLGMGADILHYAQGQKLPEKYQFRLAFSDGTGFTIHFWWFGYVHYVTNDSLDGHKMISKLGVSAVDESLNLEMFKKMLDGKKTGIKSFLVDQKNLAGIGNVYAQDILFNAKLHPNRKISTLSEEEISGLHAAIKNVLNHSIRLSGLAYEKDFYGRRGRFTSDKFLVGYKQGKPCPKCGTAIEKIRTGSTASYICPQCQPMK